jgi:hypothetical protein
MASIYTISSIININYFNLIKEFVIKINSSF